MPVGIQDFEKLRQEGCVYVDKTHLIYPLAEVSRPYFLGRPRRFGKSLLASTLKAFFLGKKELFEGLAIAELEKDWIEYPVIYIDFNRGSNDCLQSVQNLLNFSLGNDENQWDIVAKETDLSVRLARLIDVAHKKSGKKVVVIVDEYDKALVNTMDDKNANDELLNFFKGFYGVLKGMDFALRFVFLTGVTKFAKVSVFSDLNQLIDISLDDRFAEICGISEKELIEQFQPELHFMAKKTEKTYEETVAELKKRYDGYRFSYYGANMYNPFSVLKTFMHKHYAYYWFETGTPTFLIKSLRNDNYDIRKFGDDDVTIAVRSIDKYRADETSITPLLYQSGYLTIKSYHQDYDEFTLGFPNEEVKYGFLKELLPVLAPQVLNDSFSASRFTKAIEKGNLADFMTQLTAFFASIPYDAIKKEHRDEQYYQHLFYLIFELMGQFVKTEVKSAEGRADAVVKTADSIYVFEFKMDASLPSGKGRGGAATAKAALAQIDKKGYLIPYIADHRRLVKIGVEFSLEAKGIKNWTSEPKFDDNFFKNLK